MEKEYIRNYLIEEKAINDYEDDCPFVGTYLSTILELSKKIEIKMIENACDYLCNNIDKDILIYNDNTWLKRDEFVKRFKKAMEDDI